LGEPELRNWPKPRVLPHPRFGIHSQKKRYKSCHWGCTFSKGTLLYILVSEMYILAPEMYILAQMYILAPEMYILAPEMDILAHEMDILEPKMYTT